MINDLEPEKIPNKKNWIEKLISLVAGEPQDREQLMEILRDASDRNVLSTEILGMIERILQVSDMQVREVMIPKAQMIVVYKHQKLEQIMSTIIESGHSRFPVVDPKARDIVGILLAKDLLKFVFNKEPLANITNLIRPAMFISQSKRLNILLREFRLNRNHLAIVLDEFGHVTGLISIEDVLEQIVGEIEDEYDIDEENGHIKKLDDGSYIIKANTSIRDFNEYFHSTFNVENNTVGQMILNAFDHLPKRGEIIKLKNFRFKILHSDHRRVYLLEMKMYRPKKTLTQTNNTSA